MSKDLVGAVLPYLCNSCNEHLIVDEDTVYCPDCGMLWVHPFLLDFTTRPCFQMCGLATVTDAEYQAWAKEKVSGSKNLVGKKLPYTCDCEGSPHLIVGQEVVFCPDCGDEWPHPFFPSDSALVCLADVCEIAVTVDEYQAWAQANVSGSSTYQAKSAVVSSVDPATLIHATCGYPLAEGPGPNAAYFKGNRGWVHCPNRDCNQAPHVGWKPGNNLEKALDTGTLIQAEYSHKHAFTGEWHTLSPGCHPKAADPNAWGQPVIFHCKICGPQHGWTQTIVDFQLNDGKIKKLNSNKTSVSNDTYKNLTKYFRCAKCDSGYETYDAAFKCCMDKFEVAGHVSQDQLAEHFGFQPLQLDQEAADYYLLLNLYQTHKSQAALALLGQQAARLAPQFEKYIDLAIGGEVRYGDGDPAELNLPVPPQGVAGAGDACADRGLAWYRWSQWKTKVYRAEYAHTIFNAKGWWPGSTFGGKAWAACASTQLLRVKDNMDPVMWLDRVWNAQHNTGSLLNKLKTWNNPGLLKETILPAHGNDDYKTLLTYASDSVNELWQRFAEKQPQPVEEKTFDMWCVFRSRTPKAFDSHNVPCTPRALLSYVSAIMNGDVNDYLNPSVEGIARKLYGPDALNALASTQAPTKSHQKVLNRWAEKQEARFLQQEEAANSAWFQAYGRRSKYSRFSE